MPETSSTTRIRRARRPEPLARDGCNQVDNEIAPLAAWATVFPLSRGPAHRVRLHVGPHANIELVRAITADYVRELSDRVPSPGRITDDGDLVGPRDSHIAPRDELFAAVFTTDLEAIVRRHHPPAVTRVGS